MAYLQPSDYAGFGLAAETADAWVTAASAMIDAHCRRASLLSASYTERLSLSRYGTAQLTYGPATAVTALRARYGRRGRTWAMDEGLLLEEALVLGLPGLWTTLDPATTTLDTTTGELQLMPNLMGLPYAEIEATYTAGLAAVPDPVKAACAQIVRNMEATPALNVKSSHMDTLQTQYFSDSLLDSNVVALLRPFVAERLG